MSQGCAGKTAVSTQRWSFTGDMALYYPCRADFRSGPTFMGVTWNCVEFRG